VVRPAAYRVSQFFTALAARGQRLDDGPARRVLPPALFALFAAMPPEDRRHALAVLADLEARGESAPPLLQAALLHDVGKARAGVGLAHRVARVLLARPCPPLWRWLAARPTGWRRPFWVLANHAARGAVWAETAGASPDVAGLIRHHETAPPPDWEGTDLARWHASLADADGRG